MSQAFDINDRRSMPAAYLALVTQGALAGYMIPMLIEAVTYAVEHWEECEEQGRTAMLALCALIAREPGEQVSIHAAEIRALHDRELVTKTSPDHQERAYKLVPCAHKHTP